MEPLPLKDIHEESSGKRKSLKDQYRSSHKEDPLPANHPEDMEDARNPPHQIPKGKAPSQGTFPSRLPFRLSIRFCSLAQDGRLAFSWIS